MRTLYTQFSGLAGLLAFLNQLWSHAPLERTIFVGFGTGLGVYLLLILGDVAINQIVARTPPPVADDSAGTGGVRDSGKSAGKDKMQPEAKAA